MRCVLRDFLLLEKDIYFQIKYGTVYVEIIYRMYVGACMPMECFEINQHRAPTRLYTYTLWAICHSNKGTVFFLELRAQK